MIGRADIEGSKSNVAMNTCALCCSTSQLCLWVVGGGHHGLGVGQMTQLSITKGECYLCGNYSDTSSLKLLKTKGSICHAFTVCIHTENPKLVRFYLFVLHEIPILIEITLGQHII